jgi:hypothetical protein
VTPAAAIAGSRLGEHRENRYNRPIFSYKEAPFIMELAKSFEPGDIERRWYQHWEQAGYFKPSMDTTKPSFAISCRRPMSPAPCTWATPSTRPSWMA